MLLILEAGSYCLCPMEKHSPSLILFFTWYQLDWGLKSFKNICLWCMRVCMCMVAWTLTCCSLHVDVREWLSSVGSFLLLCMFEELNLVSGLWQAPWPTELSSWLMECNLTFECFTSLPKEAVLPEQASETVTIWPWTGQSEALGLWRELVCRVPYSMGDLKKEETNNHKGKDIRDPTNTFSQSLLGSCFITWCHLGIYVLTTHFFLILLSALT